MIASLESQLLCTLALPIWNARAYCNSKAPMSTVVTPAQRYVAGSGRPNALGRVGSGAGGWDTGWTVI